MKFRKRELWLLLAPLLAVAGLGTLAFMPRLRLSYDDWRLYGNMQPRLILRPVMPRTKKADGSLGYRTLWPVTYSRDMQRLKAREYDRENPFTVPQCINIWSTETGALQSSRRGSYSKFNDKEFFEPYESPWQSAPDTSPRLRQRLTDGKIRLSFTQKGQPFAYPQAVGKEKYFHVTMRAETFDIKSKRRLANFEVAHYDAITKGPGQALKGIECLPSNDASLLFIAAEDWSITRGIRRLRWICVYDTRTGRRLWRVDLPSLKGVSIGVGIAAFSSDNSLLAILRYESKGSGIVKCNIVEIRNARSGAVLQRMNISGVSNSDQWAAMQFSPDNKTLLMPCDDRLELWDVSNLR